MLVCDRPTGVDLSGLYGVAQAEYFRQPVIEHMDPRLLVVGRHPETAIVLVPYFSFVALVVIVAPAAPVAHT